MRAGARVVTEPDTVVLDHAGVLLRQLFSPTKNVVEGRHSENYVGQTSITAEQTEIQLFTESASKAKASLEAHPSPVEGEKNQRPNAKETRVVHCDYNGKRSSLSAHDHKMEKSFLQGCHDTMEAGIRLQDSIGVGQASLRSTKFSHRLLFILPSTADPAPPSACYIARKASTCFLIEGGRISRLCLPLLFVPCAHLDHVEDLSRGLLHLTHLVHQVPELGCAGHFVRGEHLHPVHRRVRLLLGGCLAAHHLVLAHHSHLQRRHINGNTVEEEVGEENRGFFLKCKNGD